MKMKNKHNLISAGAFFALLGVILGAFGAHALNSRLEELDKVAVWNTAVNYQMWHALAILVIASSQLRSRAIQIAGACFCLGILLFSGSLYWLALDGPRWLGPVTPLGGLSFIAGWAAIIWAAITAPRREKESVKT